MEKETIYGRKIKVYNKERTICDILKDRNNMAISMVNDAIKKYLRAKEKILMVKENQDNLKPEENVRASGGFSIGGVINLDVCRLNNILEDTDLAKLNENVLTYGGKELV